MNNEHFAVRIWENYFELLMKIKSKSERNALCFALVYYGFHQTLPQDVKLKESTLLLFEAIKHNIIAKNQGGRKKRFDNGLETDNKALSNNKADKQIISNKKNKPKGLSKKSFIPPTKEEVSGYAKERGREDLIDLFFDYYTVGGWKDKSGESVKNWKQKFITWENHNKPTKDPPKDVSFWDTPEGKQWLKDAEELDRLDEERKKNETNGS